MKKEWLYVILFIGGIISGCNSGKIVSEIPPKPKEYPVVKPEGDGWAYISGYYIYDRRFDEYVYVPGRWVKLKDGYYWDEGEWVKKKHGWIWKKGMWRKAKKGTKSEI